MQFLVSKKEVLKSGAGTNWMPVPFFFLCFDVVTISVVAVAPWTLTSMLFISLFLKPIPDENEEGGHQPVGNRWTGSHALLKKTSIFIGVSVPSFYYHWMFSRSYLDTLRNGIQILLMHNLELMLSGRYHKLSSNKVGIGHSLRYVHLESPLEINVVYIPGYNFGCTYLKNHACSLQWMPRLLRFFFSKTLPSAVENGEFLEHF